MGPRSSHRKSARYLVQMPNTTQQVFQFVQVVKPAKGRHQGLDCELSGGKATEHELYLEACGELWVDFQLGCDMISLYFTKVILTAVVDG